MRGFTLLEVLVALVVVALGLSAAFTAMGQSSRSAEQLRVRTLANWAAADALTSLRLANELPDGEPGRKEEISGRIWWVEYRVQESAFEALRDVDVLVSVRREARALGAARGMVRVGEHAVEEEQE